MAIEQDDVLKIIKLMDESDYDELHLEMGDLKLTIAKSGTGGLSPIKEPLPLSPVEPKRPVATSPAVADQAPPRAESTSADKAPQPEVPVQMAGGEWIDSDSIAFIGDLLPRS